MKQVFKIITTTATAALLAGTLLTSTANAGSRNSGGALIFGTILGLGLVAAINSGNKHRHGYRYSDAPAYNWYRRYNRRVTPTYVGGIRIPQSWRGWKHDDGNCQMNIKYIPDFQGFICETR